MRICLVSPNFPPMPWPCGAADFVDQFALKLAGAGHTVTIVTSNARVDSPSGGGRSVRLVPGNWGFRHVRQVREVLQEAQCDIVDVQYDAAMYRWKSSVLFLPLCFGRRRPAFVLTLHSEDLPRLGGRAWRPVQLRAYDRVVFYSSTFLKNMSNRFPRRAAAFSLMGFPSNIVRKDTTSLAPLLAKLKAERHGTQFLLSYFGHIGPNRGIEDILTCLGLLKTKGTTPQLVVIGQFMPEEALYQRDLLSLVKALGLSNQVSFAGALDAPQVSLLLQASDACVLPFPNGASLKNGSLAAAIEHGAPIVTTRGPATDSELLGSQAIETYCPGDTDRLAETVAQLIGSPGRCREMRAGTRALADFLSWGGYVERRIALYGELARVRSDSQSLLREHAPRAADLG